MLYRKVVPAFTFLQNWRYIYFPAKLKLLCFDVCSSCYFFICLDIDFCINLILGVNYLAMHQLNGLILCSNLLHCCVTLFFQSTYTNFVIWLGLMKNKQYFNLMLHDIQKDIVVLQDHETSGCILYIVCLFLYGTIHSSFQFSCLFFNPFAFTIFLCLKFSFVFFVWICMFPLSFGNLGG